MEKSEEVASTTRPLKSQDPVLNKITHHISAEVEVNLTDFSKAKNLNSLLGKRTREPSDPRKCSEKYA